MPLPDGCVALLRLAPTGLVHGHLEELKLLADLVYVSFYGTLDRWSAFLKLKHLLPAAFDELQVEIEMERELRYSSPRLRYVLTSHLQDITAKSTLALKFSFFPDGERVLWDVAGLSVAESEDREIYVDLLRRMKPPPDFPDDREKTWQAMVDRRRPFDSRMHPLERAYGISTTVAAAAAPPAPIPVGARVVYQVTYAADFASEDAELRTLQRYVLDGLTVLE